MKRVILLLLLMPFMAYGQILENFESGNVSNWVQSTEGRWKADTLSSLSGNYSLHHIYDNPEAGTDKAGIDISNLHPSEGLTTWSFMVRHGYDPSSSNNWSVFLMSDTDPVKMSPEGTTKGFAIGVNLTGTDDTLRLWKVKGNQLACIINCRINWQSDIGIINAVKIIVERAEDGSWKVYVYRPAGILISSSSGTDKELFSPSWLGIYYEYSSSRDRLLWLDDIRVDGNFYEDSEAPIVTGCELSGMNSLKLTFNEEPDDGSVVPGNFSVNTLSNNPVSVRKGNPVTFIIEFADNFGNKWLNNLIINTLCDKSGNCTQDITIPFTPVWAERGDVVISEIMADPLPQVSLPGKEYLELTNPTDYPYNLKNWILSSADQSELIPEVIITPSSAMILCLLEDTALFTKYGKVTGLEHFLSLTDGGKILCLSDSSGNLVHGVEYSSDWFGNELKSGGGWSLEMKDTRFPFYDEGNWTASESRKGGTPGSVNSVSQSNPDNSFFGVQNVYPDDSISLTVRFSEPVFDLDTKYGNIMIGDREVIKLHPTDPLFREYHFIIGDPLINGEVYQLDISGDLNDFAGNVMERRNFSFGLTESAGPGDILFNELLFNPLPGDQDYIELFNASEKVIDVSRLQLVSLTSGTGDTSQLYPVSDEKRCIIPRSYFAVTTDRLKICERYLSSDPLNLFQNGSLPSMSDDQGRVILFNMELDKIDEVSYDEKMHYSLLSGNEGVALEKTWPDNESMNPVNWHSASESAGWGTPGAPNSVFIELPQNSDKVILSSGKISPDGDGYEDILFLRLNLTGNGNVVSVTIFDETGNYVKKIVTNMFAGTEATLIWDGTADDGSPVKTGIYIVYITLYDDTGKTNKWKKVCTVIRK
jgi:hypothetical protein